MGAETGRGGVLAVGGQTAVVQVTPTVETSAYADGDLVGEKLTLTNAGRIEGGSLIVHSIVLADKAKQSAALDVVFFFADPSGTTFTDNAALDVADADLEKIAGVVSIAASDYADFNDNSVATVRNIGLLVDLPDGERDLYACLVTRGTPTYVETDDVDLSVGILQD